MKTQAAPEKPLVARKVPKRPDGPESVIERQATISLYLLHRKARSRERFRRRVETTTLRGELLRSGYLAGCVLLDGVGIPELVFLFPGPAGWIATFIVLGVAVYAEYRFYAARFALRNPASEAP